MRSRFYLSVPGFQESSQLGVLNVEVGSTGGGCGAAITTAGTGIAAGSSVERRFRKWLQDLEPRTDECICCDKIINTCL